jgi:thymidylate synthase (FAD)
MNQSAELKFWHYQDERQLLQKLEEIGRNAYQSFERTTEDSCYKFMEMIINKKHLGILEHEYMTLKIITNRAIANELVRHRHASYVQESTRYVNYLKKTPVFISNANMDEDCHRLITKSFETYERLIESGMAPEFARDFLPLGLKTTIYATMNIRSWFHFLSLRLAPNAHPMMRELASLIAVEFHKTIPFITKHML